MAWWE